MGDVEPQSCAERIFFVFRAEHALRYVAAATGFRSGIPASPPLHRQVKTKCNDRQCPQGIGGPAEMEGRKEGENRTGGLSRLTHHAIHVGQLDFEHGQAAKFGDGDPREHDDHGHLQNKLEQIGDQHAPEAADEGVNAGEGDEDQDADQQRGVRGCSQGVMQENVAADGNLQHASGGDGVAEQNRGDADHGFDHPAEDQAIHQRAKINGAKTTQEGGRLAFVAELDKFHVGKDFRAAPISGKEKNGHHAAETLRPPQPVAGDSVFSYQASDKQRSVGGKSGGYHGGARKPPGNISSRYEKFFGAPRGAPAVIQTDQQIEEQVGGDYDPVGGGECHLECLLSCCG